MRTIAIWAASTVLAAVGGSTGAFAVTSAQADAGVARVQLGDVQPASFVRSGGRIVPATAGDDHRSRHAEPGDDHGRHAEPGDDHGRHAEPGDDHGGRHGRHGGHGSDG